MHQTYLRRDTDRPMDIMHFIYSELWQAIIEKKSRIYAPFIQTLINHKWLETTGTRFPKDNITIHEEKKLCVSKHQKPRSQEEKDAELQKVRDEARGPSSAPGGSRAGGPSLQRQ